jgi:hypothetical protein
VEELFKVRVGSDNLLICIFFVVLYLLGVDNFVCQKKSVVISGSEATRLSEVTRGVNLHEQEKSGDLFR